MAEPATFDESDWAALTGAGKKALRILHSYGFSLSFEPLSRAAGVGQKSMNSLIEMGLAIEGDSGIHGRCFKLTDKGALAIEWLQGRRTRAYPT